MVRLQASLLLKVSALVASAVLTACGEQNIVYEISDQPAGEMREVAGTKSNHRASRNYIHSLVGWTQQVKIYASAETPDELLPMYAEAAETWNEGVGFELIRFAGKKESLTTAGEAGLFRFLADDESGIYYDQEWLESTGKREVTLATTVWESSQSDPDVILKADIVLNAWRYHYADVLTLDPAELEGSEYYVDLVTVLIHEMGHMIGLDHTDPTKDPLSVMHAETAIGADYHRRDLSAADKQLIRSIYRRPLTN